MQPWGAREGGGGREGTRQRPRWDRWREGAGRRWAEPDGRAGATGGVGVGRPSSPPPASPPPSRAARLLAARAGNAGRARPLAGGSSAPAWASGTGSEARGRCVRAACARLCAQGRPGGRRHVEASLARVSRPVGKAGRGVRMARPRSLGFRAGDWGGGDCPPGSSGRDRDPCPEPELTQEGQGASQQEAEGPRLRSGRGRWGAGTQAARMGRGWRVR